MNPYLVGLITVTAIYALMGMSMQVAMGYGGMINLGIAGLIAIGGYTSAILVHTHHWPVLLAILAGSILATTFGALLAIPARRIKGDYYALVALGFLFVVQAFLTNMDEITRGTLGIPGILRPSFAVSAPAFCLFVLGVTAVSYFILSRGLNSPFGRALEAVRDDEDVAASLGKPVFRLRVIAMLLCGFFAGLSGALLAHYIQFISPNMFYLDPTVPIISAVMMGGLASLRGGILGTCVLTLMVEIIRFMPVPFYLVGPLRLMVYMVALLLVVLIWPKGIMGRAQLVD